MATAKALQERDFIFDYAKLMEERLHDERLLRRINTLALHVRYQMRLNLEVSGV